MAYTSAYTNFGTRRGFKLHNTRKFSVVRLRARILCFFRILTRWRHQTLRAIKRGICRDDYTAATENHIRQRHHDRFPSCRKGLVEDQSSGRLKSFARSNSFYTEAIKECLEFIKRTSVSSVNESEVFREEEQEVEEEEEEEDHIIQSRTSSSRLINTNNN